jgi:hypothetical protein
MMKLMMRMLMMMRMIVLKTNDDVFDLGGGGYIDGKSLPPSLWV